MLLKSIKAHHEEHEENKTLHAFMVNKRFVNILYGGLPEPRLRNKTAKCLVCARPRWRNETRLKTDNKNRKSKESV